MNDMEKLEQTLNLSRQYFMEFMTNVLTLPVAHHQMQQACIRFDEGLMWLHNAIAGHAINQGKVESNE